MSKWCGDKGISLQKVVSKMKKKIQYSLGLKLIAGLILLVSLLYSMVYLSKLIEGTEIGAFTGQPIEQNSYFEYLILCGPQGGLQDADTRQAFDDLAQYYAAGGSTDATMLQTRQQLESIYSADQTNIRARVVLVDANGVTTSLANLGGAWNESTVFIVEEQSGAVRLQLGYDPNLPAFDSIRKYVTIYEALSMRKNEIVYGMIACGALAVAMAIYLLLAAGHRAGQADDAAIQLRFFDRWPVAVILLPPILGVIVALLLWEFYYFNYTTGLYRTDWELLMVSSISGWIIVLTGLFSLRSLTVRCKAKCLLRTTLIYMMIKPVWHLLTRWGHAIVHKIRPVPVPQDAAPLSKNTTELLDTKAMKKQAQGLAVRVQTGAHQAVARVRAFRWEGSGIQGIMHRLFHLVRTIWKTIYTIIGRMSLTKQGMLLGSCVVGLYLLFALMYDGFFMTFILSVVVLIGLWWILRQAVKVHEGAQHLSEGDLTYQIDTRHLHGAFRVHAERLGCISSGMANEVERRMKSEHLKTELLTNVSHDIKTPLTSIINYVDLLQKTELEPPQAREYAAVLERQSLRLKKLLEDLIEASKAATGNINVTLEPTDAAELLRQAQGEYSERLHEKGLIPVLRLGQEEACMITADGRLLWRVFDNLLGNIVKYSMENTRVYLELHRETDHCRIILKNISREELNIESEELMERFVRGDTARATEGSGLGLSIARSLTECMGGNFELCVDGDLFKVILSFQLAV